MAHKLLPGMPFLKNTKLILILHTLKEVAAPAPLLCPYGADQGSDRLRKLQALVIKG